MIDYFIFHGGVDAIVQMIKSGQNLKYGFWCLSNIAAGIDTHKESLLLAEGLAVIFTYMTDEHPNDIRKEACWVVTNFLSTAEKIDLKMKVASFHKYKVISLLIKCLKSIDNDLTL